LLSAQLSKILINIFIVYQLFRFLIKLVIQFLLSSILFPDLVLQVAKSIKIVMTSRSASVKVTLDMKTIREAQLSLDANIVRELILETPKIKRKLQVRTFHMVVFSICKVINVNHPMAMLTCSVLMF